MVTSVQKGISCDAVPQHVAVIMDGNGRWARRRILPRQAGHRAGIKPVRQMVEQCIYRGVEFLTLFAFSSENWQRPQEEIRRLMALFIEALNREVAELDENGVRLNFMGETELLSPALQESIEAAEIRTQNNSRMNLTLAVAYGGRADLVNAAKKIARQVSEGALDPEQIDETHYASALEMAQLPDVDLLIRTGGEQRISNFLLWSLAYTELYFSDVLWPDFGIDEMKKALDFYTGRQRRFGRTGEQIEGTRC
jgi:undecaprenyl diphosphate synthase